MNCLSDCRTWSTTCSSTFTQFVSELFSCRFMWTSRNVKTLWHKRRPLRVAVHFSVRTLPRVPEDKSRKLQRHVKHTSLANTLSCPLLLGTHSWVDSWENKKTLNILNSGSFPFPPAGKHHPIQNARKHYNSCGFELGV